MRKTLARFNCVFLGRKIDVSKPKNTSHKIKWLVYFKLEIMNKPKRLPRKQKKLLKQYHENTVPNLHRLKDAILLSLRVKSKGADENELKYVSILRESLLTNVRIAWINRRIMRVAAHMIANPNCKLEK